MSSQSTPRFLKDVARELRGLGPFERRRAVAEIEADLQDLARDGMPGQATSARMDQATTAMPTAREVAASYLERSRPPVAMIRISLLLNLLLALLAASFFVYALATLWKDYGAIPPIAMLVLGGLAASCGLAAFFYALAGVRPGRALRWRFAVLPLEGLAIIVDALLGAVPPVTLAQPGSIDGSLAFAAFAVPFIILLGGLWSTAYTHGQLPRLGEPTLRTSRDYFQAVERNLDTIDLRQRREIIMELRAHVREAGVDLAAMPAAQRYAAASGALGPPMAIAAAYLVEAKPPSRVQRAQLGLSSVSAAIGVLFGLVTFAHVGAALCHSQGCRTAGFSAVGLAGLALLPLSLAVVFGVGRLRQSPGRWPDLGPPTMALGLVVALLASAVVGGLLSGGLNATGASRGVSVLGSAPTPDGGLDVLWGEGESSGLPGGVDFVDRSWLTHLDPDRKIIGTEAVPFTSGSGPVIGFARGGLGWILVSPDAVTTWGQSAGGMSIQTVGLATPAWSTVGASIRGNIVTVNWGRWSSGPDLVEVGSTTLDMTGPNIIAEWSRYWAVHGYAQVHILNEADRFLVALSILGQDAGWSNMTLNAFLLDDSGRDVANLTLGNWSQPSVSGTPSASIDSSIATGGAFWLGGWNSTVTNGTSELEAWALRIDRNGTAAWHPLGGLSGPAASIPPRDGDPRLYTIVQLLESPTYVVVVSSLYRDVFRVVNGSLTTEPDLTVGGISLSRFGIAGALEYQTFVASPGTDFLSRALILTDDAGSPVIIQMRVGTSATDPWTLRALTVPPNLQIGQVEVPMDIHDAPVLYPSLGVPAFMTETSRGPVEFGGVTFFEDFGFLGWRGHYDYAPAPAFLQVDLSAGNARVILLAAPSYARDGFAEILAVTVTTVVISIALFVQYPRWRARGLPPARDHERRTGAV